MTLNVLRLFLRLAAICIAIATIVAGVLYTGFMAVWMHAPPFQVIVFSLLLCIPVMLIAWGAFRLAHKFENKTT
jgi:hypothetical protein